MHLFNHYSAPIVALLLLAAGIPVVARRGGKKRDWLILAGTMLAFAGGWLVFRPVASVSGRDAGQPVLLEVQSPYCLGCVALKPVVDRLEKQLRGKVRVRRVNVQSAEGSELVTNYGIEFTPTFIFFDAACKEQWRSVGHLDAERVRADCR